MIVVPNKPFAALSGVITGVNPDNLNERYYFRTNKQTGRVYLKKCPVRGDKPWTPAQIAAQQRFGEIYGKGRRIQRNCP